MRGDGGHRQRDVLRLPGGYGQAVQREGRVAVAGRGDAVGAGGQRQAVGAVGGGGDGAGVAAVCGDLDGDAGQCGAGRLVGGLAGDADGGVRGQADGLEDVELALAPDIVHAEGAAAVGVVDVPGTVVE
ncbi:hypothetical protein GCM10025734_04680 [Kitasatospora paranensis]